MLNPGLKIREDKMVETCSMKEKDVMILACSGGSNVGQLSNQAAVELTQEGLGKLYCLAGIGGQLSGFVQSAKDVPVMVAIDGCQVACAKTILEQTQVPLNGYVVITDEGIEKNKNLNLQRDEIDRIKAAVKRAVSAAGPSVGETLSSSCDCG
jgi:uncharacterized metal-binding protein